MNRIIFFFYKKKSAYEMRISDWSSDVCSSDLVDRGALDRQVQERQKAKEMEKLADQLEGMCLRALRRTQRSWLRLTAADDDDGRNSPATTAGAAAFGAARAPREGNPQAVHARSEVRLGASRSEERRAGEECVRT